MSFSPIIAEAIENDEPVTIDGFTLYPIQVRQYRQFSAVQSSLLIRQGSLPVDYAVRSYLGALHAMDIDAYKESGQALGLIRGILTMLALSMRFPADVFARQATIKVRDGDERELASIQIHAGEMILSLTPAVFDRLRPVIAAQNGLELPDETENADLVEAENDISSQDAISLNLDFNTLLASVARDQHCRRKDLLDYTIREFFELRDAIQRDKLFTLYKMAELNGTKFTKGNPWPSWCYESKAQSNALISMAQFMAGPGSAATMK